MSLDIAKYPTLALAENPDELRSLPKESLPKLCDELRQYLLDSVSRSSGHFASGLGTVELTVALHYVYHTPFDHLVWDVGHQAYPHKILTGRRDKISTIRQKNGLHPFPWRAESEYDVLSVGHSSTSISAGLGMAVAAAREGKNRRTVCVIGDGAITAGMAFEAMNHAGDIDPDMLVVLNDNEMSISENVGALNNHLAQLLSGKLYSTLREGGKKVLSGLPPIKELVKRTEEHLKGMVVPGTLFEELGFNYIGPVDGHDVQGLVATLKNMRDLKGPQLLHIMTKKGRGYAPAEKDPISFHAVPKFDPASGTLPKSAGGLPTYSKIFGDWLCETAAKDSSLMAITPAMREGSGMVQFSRDYPQQYFDVAIAEQHAVTFAAGLAIGGYKPVVAIYSTFLQRAYDQLIHDVAIQNLPVMFAIDRGGIVGADGQTHQGAFDLSFMRCIPTMVIMTPSDENECRQMLYTGYHYNEGPSAVRYPRGTGTGAPLEPLSALPIGKGVVRREGEKLAILNFGTLLPEAAQVAEALNATLVDMRFVKPLDEQLVLELAASHDALVTLEENAIMGGAGSGVNELLMAKRRAIPVLNIGLPDSFISQGSQEEVRVDLGLDAAGIQQKIEVWLAQ
ncbi:MULTISPECIES: 1-deoxy-D-xylulose-5-phosphate synthase [Serratia]|jgi:1-deoxy-D-xylulose-5-phosphate synthase|uniref:1-deoxy-D-xylulose-5-phosphate synthase n=1 Tax=Serratia liquefaciens TaxID=614 RepID=A0A515CZH4_SERLI|nr:MULTISPECIES: 1-deoxy-D-xylulose-5-phosphate synthase [Serratia]AYO36538.1 1-deoxy-D-xylulose-5-phosphate synthase [Serratia sp. P2ACOL2]MBV0840505.1 1-deoxy-D-xylulose-5-phosphate synthase [Serratia liquefaciens]MDU4174875.1 1-deoxy-D-xylulose-5-phosphate synthase [Serratia liquefaciens]MDU5486804.1 1-deoxy-D-xylulose-5-phosphate synthase [Serratia liquefaciens]PVD45564.1 1-deoxy-D-xylulose-5-phosphate synthase [Serratia liquefaciens]